MSQSELTPATPTAAHPARARGLGAELARIFGQRSFRIAALVLLAAAIGLNVATQSLHLYFRKLPVPLRRDLDSLGDNFGHWECVSKDEILDKELIKTLGTEQFIFRHYVDTNVVSAAEIAQFTGKSLDERRVVLQVLRQAHPEAVVDCDVTYYTGKADTVAHIPERCWIANGYRSLDGTKTQTWDVDGKALQLRYITFEDDTGAAHIPSNVVYFFHTAGHYESDPLEVRDAMQGLRNRYAYYAKIEVMTLLRDQTVSAQVMRDFLGEALPRIEEALPTQDTLTALDKAAH